MRFDSARDAGLSEEQVALITDDALNQLSKRQRQALKLADMLIGLPSELSPQDCLELEQEFTTSEVAELVLSVGLFLGMSKVLITLGLEPEEMATTVVPTPGSTA